MQRMDGNLELRLQTIPSILQILPAARGRYHALPDSANMHERS